jgi:hypothetical protein
VLDLHQDENIVDVLMGIAWCAGWVATGLGCACVIRRLGYHAATWFAVGAISGPITLVAWMIRCRRTHPRPEVVDAGRPARGDVDLLVLPMRGPTPVLVRALSELRGAKRRVTVARVVPFDTPRRELARCRVHLLADRDALGLPTAELVLLFGAPARSIESYVQAAGVGLVLVDGGGVDLAGRLGLVDVVTPDDVPPAERRRSVRVLEPVVRPTRRNATLDVEPH